MNISSTMVIRAGRITGSTIDHSNRNRPAPSSSAAVMDYWLKHGYDANGILDAARYGFVTLYSTSWEVLARLPVHENPMLAPVHLRTSDFSHGKCGKAVYEHPSLGKHEFNHAVYGMDIPKDATEITVADFQIDLNVTKV